MAFLGKAKKSDLISLAIELEEEVTNDLRVIDLRELITKSKKYEVEFVANMLDAIADERVEKEELERQNEERAFELEKQNKELEKQRIELECLRVKQGSAESVVESFNQNFQKLMLRFNIQTDNMGLLLELFEKQAEFAQIPNGRWVSYLIGILLTEINNLIARKPEEKARDYAYIKSLLLQRFKLTAEKFRQLMVKSQKSPDSTWHDFYHKLKHTLRDG
ncbi:hypothetical protein AVEN_207038-1 [Araneus ventricosus]|uniref:Uncharacterized protein n=1 Tax=Araneus ventricosus TaxID=182803 RepID=A0A4Y2K122_ARAVE|nr:hypothetical protein AVEN_207038-1 [Araneus ventricosus]